MRTLFVVFGIYPVSLLYVGNNSTESQTRVYVSIILSFLGMKSIPGVFRDTGVRDNPDSKITEKYIQGQVISVRSI